MKINKGLLWLVLIIYFLIVIKLTLFKDVIGTIKYDKIPSFPLIYRWQMMQLVPFHTIKQYIVRDAAFQHHFRNISSSQKIEFVLQNLLGNIILFMPLGLLIPAIYPAKRSMIKIIIISFLCSFTIEVTQFVSSRGIFDVDDLILNTIGGVLGYFLFNLILKRVRY